VRQALLSFVTAAGEEGFRQALGAHNTTQLCMTNSGCRDTVQIFIEEIIPKVMADQLSTWRGFCGDECLANYTRLGASQAAVVAMAVGQKHFYSNVNFWNRWSPLQMLELDQAIRLLSDQDSYGFNHSSFRYSALPETPLVYRGIIPREEVRKILSTVSGWEAAPERQELVTAAAPDADRFLFGASHTQYKETTNHLDLHEGNPDKVQLSSDERDQIQRAYKMIAKAQSLSQTQGFTTFLYNERLYNKTAAETSQMWANESFWRLKRDFAMPYGIAITKPQDPALEDEQLHKRWNWTDHAYGVHELGLGDIPRSRLFLATQWVADSQAQALKTVEGGYTHQPWTFPWFFEYSTNATHTSGLRPDMNVEEAQEYLDWAKDSVNASAIRGYTVRFRFLPKFDEAPSYAEVIDERGAIRSFEYIDRLPESGLTVGAVETAFLAITGDGRAMRRYFDPSVEKANNKTYYKVLDGDKKPVYTEEGKPVTIVYDDATGLLETRYGRAFRALDKAVGGQ
jgi:hypothetical protein